MTTDWDMVLDRASSSFTARAVLGGLVEVRIATMETPVGELLLAATDAGLVRVAFDVEDHAAVRRQLARTVSPRVLTSSDPVLDAAAAQLHAYFTGQVREFDVPLDLRLVRGVFRREVLDALGRIPSGETRTYGELAAEAGRPRAVRAVGTGCATNPVPIIVPCHRVTRTGGDVGNYLGGADRKRWLLAHEQRLAS